MAAAGDTQPVNTAADKGARAHDEVQMLSLRADGSPDQNDPELIGDVDATKEATRKQFRQQAVSAADRVSATDAGTDVSTTPDPGIEKAEKAHKAAVKQAEKDADATVEKLTK